MCVSVACVHVLVGVCVCVYSKLEESLVYINAEVEVFPLWVCVVKATLPCYRMTDSGSQGRHGVHASHVVDIGKLLGSCWGGGWGDWVGGGKRSVNDCERLAYLGVRGVETRRWYRERVVVVVVACASCRAQHQAGTVPSVRLTALPFTWLACCRRLRRGQVA